jgi:hypothetical protein
MNISFDKIIITLMLSSITTLGLAEIEISESLEGLTEAEKAWLLDDSSLDVFTVASEKLKWSSKASKDNYWVKNSLTISKQSLTNGWIRFDQCHYQLDPVAKIEVSYHPEKTKSLKVLSNNGINQVEVVGSFVVLQGVKKGAQVCISGSSKTLTPEGRRFSINRGPYMRKFLDGYFPMIVEESIQLEDDVSAKLISQTPNLENSSNNQNKKSKDISDLTFKYAFEGVLQAHYLFERQD